eukprot:TRINITY_DN61720_c0_g1_i1.p1 TRINITY_DN61720_c0_g1~~TRINITY_DN61720_c0_g1_i1.p1  ORF type:complete len:1116 (+),score=122.53 TRINITY_DN61720_c0_g1_i1:49-3348(+)
MDAQRGKDIDKRFNEIIAKAKSKNDPYETSGRRGTPGGVEPPSMASRMAETPRSTFDETKQMMEKLRASISNLSEQIDDSLSPHASMMQNRSPIRSGGGGYSPPRRQFSGQSFMGSEEFRNTALAGLRSRNEWTRHETTTITTTNNQLGADGALPNSNLNQLLNKRLSLNTLRSQSTPAVPPSRASNLGLENDRPLLVGSSSSVNSLAQQQPPPPTNIPIGGSMDLEPYDATAFAGSHTPAQPRTHSTMMVSGILQELEEDRARMIAEIGQLERERAHFKEVNGKQAGVIEQLQHALHQHELKAQGTEQELVETRHDLSCLKREYEQMKKQNDWLLAKLDFIKINKRDEAESDRNMVIFLTAEKERLLSQVELLKHNITTLLEVYQTNVEDLQNLGLEMSESAGMPTLTAPPQVQSPSPIHPSSVISPQTPVDLAPEHSSKAPEPHPNSPPSYGSGARVSPPRGVSPQPQRNVPSPHQRYPSPAATAAGQQAVQQSITTTTTTDTTTTNATRSGRTSLGGNAPAQQGGVIAVGGRPSRGGSPQNRAVYRAEHRDSAASTENAQHVIKQTLSNINVSAQEIQSQEPPPPPTIALTDSEVKPRLEDMPLSQDERNNLEEVVQTWQEAAGQGQTASTAEQFKPTQPQQPVRRPETGGRPSQGEPPATVIPPSSLPPPGTNIPVLSSTGVVETQKDVVLTTPYVQDNRSGSPSEIQRPKAQVTVHTPSEIQVQQKAEKVVTTTVTTQQRTYQQSGQQESQETISGASTVGAVPGSRKAPEQVQQSATYTAPATNRPDHPQPTGGVTSQPQQPPKTVEEVNFSSTGSGNQMTGGTATTITHTKTTTTSGAVHTKGQYLSPGPSSHHRSSTPDDVEPADLTEDFTTDDEGGASDFEQHGGELERSRQGAITPGSVEGSASVTSQRSASSNIMRSLPNLPTNNSPHEACIDGLKKGYILLKYNLSNAKASRKFVSLSPDLRRLVWSSKQHPTAKPSVVHISTVSEITYNFMVHKGKEIQPAKTKSKKSHLRFSLMTQGRSVDFEAESREVFIIVFIALYSLVHPNLKPLTVGNVLWKIFNYAATPTFGKEAKGSFCVPGEDLPQQF